MGNDNGDITVRHRNRRMVSRKGLTTGERANTISDRAFRTLMLLNVNADDEGRGEGSPYDVKVNCLPARPLTIEEVAKDLKELADNNLIIWYEVDGKQYYQMVDFSLHQTFHGIKKYPSGYPAPPETKENGVPTTPEINNSGDTNPQEIRDKGQEIRDKENLLSQPEVPTPPQSPPEKEKRGAATKEKKVPIFGEGSDPYKVALHLRNRLHSWQPTLKLPPATPKGLAKWALEIDRAIRLDKCYPGDLISIIDWMHDTEPPGYKGFRWRDNILSTAKLRQKYGKIIISRDRGVPTPDVGGLETMEGTKPW